MNGKVHLNITMTATPDGRNGTWNQFNGRQARRAAERLARKEAKKQQSAQKFCSAAHPPVEVA